MPPSATTLPARAFRYRLTLMLLRSDRPLTIADLVDGLRLADALPHGRASKVVSDALRWEMRRGRVRRVGRGVYVALPIPRSTRSWMHSQLDELRVLEERRRFGV